MDTSHTKPSLDAWLREIKSVGDIAGTGMYLVHNGVVRGTSRDGRPVSGMILSVDRMRLAELLESARLMEGVTHVRAWVNEGELTIGDDIMYVLVAGDIRDHVFDALGALVRMIKTEVVAEEELRP
ncbi:MAG: molybdopterin converting factor [Actinobacteria bacterium HGW-Actinobacteria-6]|jgi:molybdopterin synthase catalytic subunit|nr:MAG: molybdopterin converting factor [Actinobacteria bacterium HGW-Actinobacteria-6]